MNAEFSAQLDETTEIVDELTFVNLVDGTSVGKVSWFGVGRKRDPKTPDSSAMNPLPDNPTNPTVEQIVLRTERDVERRPNSHARMTDARRQPSGTTAELEESRSIDASEPAPK